MNKVNSLIALVTVSALTHGIAMDVYFGTQADGIYHAAFDSDKGKLDDAERAAAIKAPGFLALHPDKQKLYAAGRRERAGVVAGYHIQPGGTLELFTEQPIGEGNGTHIAAHPSGRFLLTVQYGAGSVALFPLDKDGRLGEPSLTRHEGGSGVVPRRQDKPHPHWCGFSPDGRFAFVPDLGMDGIVIYRVDPDAPAMQRHGFAASIPGGGPRHMRFSADGAFIFCLNELDVSVSTFRYDAEAGTAKYLSTTPALSEEVKAREEFNSGAEILAHPSGRFVYSSNRGHDSITGYRVEPESGALTVIGTEPIRGAWPRNINMDASGRWLLAAGAHSDTISVFAIDPESGRLTYKKQSIINVPNPICVLFAE